MNNKYLNPPLVTASCEVRVSRDESTKWNKVYVGELYTALKKDYPNNEDITSVEGQFVPEQSKYDVVKFPETKFYSENNSLLISDTRIKVICNAPYSGWQIFGEKVNQAIREYKKITKPKAIEDIALIYTNKISISATEKKVLHEKDYFNIDINYSALGMKPARIESKVVFPQENGDYLILSFAIVPNSKAVKFDCYIELIYVIAKQNLTKATKIIGDSIDLAHKTIERCFEAIITEKARELFND
mgnify:FL=1